MAFIPGRFETRLLVIGCIIVLVAYSATLSIANDLQFSDALLAGVANTIPTIFFGLIVYWIIHRFVTRWTPVLQCCAHILLGSTFAILAYWLLLILLGIISGASAVNFEVRPFVSRAMAWQSLQNVTVYALIAILAYSPLRKVKSEFPETESKAGQGARERYFIRTGDELLPIDTADIVAITGADDYSEIATTTGGHLARTTLSQFEHALDADRFIRIHRSRIVNVDHVLGVEPSGDGRLLVHMDNGKTVTSSRTGAKAIRARII